MKKFLALLQARNKEFMRDKATLAWNFLFPFVVLFALGIVFSGDERNLYKVGVIEHSEAAPLAFLKTRFVDFIPIKKVPEALDKVRRHQYDMIVEVSSPPGYWINEDNPKSYFLERALWASDKDITFQRKLLEGRKIRYVDWLLPGVLGMNLMFSCLFGVGFVIVRYRQGGILRRLKVAPIHAFHFITAQVVSRLGLAMFVTVVLFLGLDLFLDFQVVGSLFSLFLIFLIGSFCLITLGLLIAARTSSQELAGGLLNLVSWPMMIFSGVWFSMEGSPQWLIWASKAFPLTHLVDAARGVMVDGLTLATVWPQLAALTAMSLVFLALASWLFRWD